MSIEGKRALVALRAEGAAVAAEQDTRMTPAEVEAFVDGYVAALSSATEPEPAELFPGTKAALDALTIRKDAL